MKKLIKKRKFERDFRKVNLYRAGEGNNCKCGGDNCNC